MAAHRSTIIMGIKIFGQSIKLHCIPMFYLNHNFLKQKERESECIIKKIGKRRRDRKGMIRRQRKNTDHKYLRIGDYNQLNLLMSLWRALMLAFYKKSKLSKKSLASVVNLNPLRPG